MKHVLWAIAAACLLLAGPAGAQSPGTVNLVGPSQGGQQITPQAVNNAVNNALRAKQDYPGSGGGGTPANPTATAGSAAVNGSASTYMRSDAAPAVQTATTGQLGLVKPDGTTVTISSGTISAVGGIATTITPGTTTVTGTSAPCVIYNPSGTVISCQILPVVGGGTGTSTPSLINGTNISITGTWPNQTINATGGGTPGNPTATAGPTAINGSSSAFMRADAAPAVQLGSNVIPGLVRGDGATFSVVGGVGTSIGGAATSITAGVTTVGGTTAPCILDNPSSTVLGCDLVGDNVITALGVAVGSPGAFVVLGGAGGTPSSLTGTNITGTAAGLTAGITNALKSATTTVSVSAATAPSVGQALVATDSTHATWQAVTAAASSITPGTTTIIGATAPCVIANPATTLMGCLTETGTGSVVMSTSPTLVTPALGTPTALFLTNATGLPIAGITGLGTGVGTALGIAVGSAGGPVTNGGALGTPSSGVGTNLTGTAAGLTAGTATVANGLKSATTTVSVSGATAPTSGQVLTATAGTTATWQTPGTGSGTLTSVTATTADILVNGGTTCTTGACTVATTVPLIASSTSPYIYNGTGTSGTGAQVDNTYLIELTGSSPAMTLPQAGTTGFAAGVGSSVLMTGTGTATLTPTTSTLGGLVTLSLAPHQFASFASDGTNYEVALGLPPSGTQNLVLATPNGSTGQPKLRALVAADIPSIPISTGVSGLGTGVATALAVNVGSAGAPVVLNGAGGTPSSMTGTNITGIPNAAVAAAPVPTPGSGATLVAPRSYYVCTTTCTVTLPTPAAGMEFCVRNDNNVSTVITFAAITSVQFENTNFTSYKTANTSIVSGGAAGDKLCVLGRDATHYLVMSFNGTWS
jgi:hypothetical protein